MTNRTQPDLAVNLDGSIKVIKECKQALSRIKMRDWAYAYEILTK